MLTSKKIIVILISGAGGFTTFLLVVFTAELISVSIGYNPTFSLEPVHIQISSLGAVLQGIIYFFKSQKPV